MLDYGHRKDTRKMTSKGENKKKTLTIPYQKDMKRLVKHAGIGFLGGIWGKAAQYLYSIILARYLGARLLGIYFLALGLVDTIGTISRFALNEGILKFVPLYWGKQDVARTKGTVTQALKIGTINGIIAAGIIFLFSEKIAVDIFHCSSLAPALKVASFTIPIFSFTILALTVTQAFHTLKYMVFVNQIFRPLFKIALGILLFLLGGKLFAALSVHIISLILGVFLALRFLYLAFPGIKNKETITETKKLLSYSFPLFLGVVFYFLLTKVDTFMLAYFRSIEEVGIYNITVNTVMLLFLIGISFRSIFTPMISNLYNRKEMKQLEFFYKTLSRWIFTLALPVFLLFIIFPKQIMTIFGAKFVDGWQALFLLAIALFVYTFSGLGGQMLKMSGKQNLTFYNTLIIFFLNLGLNLLLIPRYGMPGAAFATGTSLVILNIIALIQVRLGLKMGPFSKKYLPALTAGIITGIVTLLLKKFILGIDFRITLLSGIFIIFTLYSLVLFLFGIWEEDKIILRAVKEKIGFL